MAPPSTSSPSSGRILSWDGAKGYGFVEFRGRRVFLHRRDFAERHKTPEVGDVIDFVLGTDAHGRTCAKAAVHRDHGGRWQLTFLSAVLLLVILPTMAAWQVAAQMGLAYLGITYGGLSWLTFWAYRLDKGQARTGQWRTQETTLHLMSLIGGWPGAFLAQRRYRHKCSKLGFQLQFWLIVALHQYVALETILGWRITRGILELIPRA